MPLDSISLTPEQRHALQLMMSGHNVFLTGKAGTGKTAVLRCLKECCGGSVAFVAPTGLAALNIGGSTIHRLFGIPPVSHPMDVMSPLAPDHYELLNAFQAVVIDEVSMLRGDVFAALDTRLREAAPTHLKDQPFGGKPTIAVGDFAQLPPVVTEWDDPQLFKERYGGIFAFETQVWQDAGFRNVVLNTVHRQAGDPRWLGILNVLREGGAGPHGYAGLAAAVAQLNHQVPVGSPPDHGTCLCTTNCLVDRINRAKDAILPGPTHSFSADTYGDFPREMYPVDPVLDLKVSSRILLVKNTSVASQPEEFDYVNGDTGIVRQVDEQKSVVHVELDRGGIVTVRRTTWVNYDYVMEEIPGLGPCCVGQIPIGWYHQFPIRLGYAITIHKSQGMTLDTRVHIVLGRGAFACGQTYVAFSRCPSLDQISLDRPLYIEDVLVDPKVTAFHESLDCSWDGQGLARDAGGCSVPL